MKTVIHKDQYTQMLSDKKIQPTAMRLLTLEFLLEQRAAVSLSDIEAHFFRADRVTLYRTLKTFEQKGLIHSIQEQNTTKYAFCDEHCEAGIHHDEHLHFYCIQCRETICLNKVDTSTITLPKGFSAQQWFFSAKGICDRCAAKRMQ